MTGLELLNAFNIEGRTFQKTSKTKFETSEIQYLLNKAQDITFQKYYDRFEQSEDKRFGLDELITVANLVWATDQSVDQVGIKPYGRIWKMPVDFFYSVEENGLDSLGNFIRIKPIGRDYYNLNIINPLKKPDSTLAWRLDHKPYAGEDLKRRETVSNDSVILDQYTITYIKRPADIDITDSTNEIELGYKATQELISEAIALAYGVDKDQVGYQITNNENNKNNK